MADSSLTLALRRFAGVPSIAAACGLLSLVCGAGAMWLTVGAVRCGAGWSRVLLLMGASAFLGWLAKGGPRRSSDEVDFEKFLARTGGLSSDSVPRLPGPVEDALRASYRAGAPTTASSAGASVATDTPAEGGVQVIAKDTPPRRDRPRTLAM